MGSLGGLSPGGTIAIGILVGLLSTSVQSLGLTLQRKSHILEDEKLPHEIRRPPYRRGRWQLGMGMFIAANILGSSVQISTLPLPVLSTLQASGLVFNSICATLILAEPFTTWSLWGTLLVCSGAVLIAIFGAIPSPPHDLEELLALLGRGAFITWMVLQGLLVVTIAVLVDALNTFSNLGHDSRFRFSRGLAYGCISGILSAHSLLVAKSAVELIIKTFSGASNQFVHWQSWILVLALITLALCQLYYLHRGLKLVSTSVLYPLVFCVYNIVAILDGLIYFNQADLLGPLRGCLIALGTIILLSGVLALSWRLSDEQHTPGVGQSTLAPGLGLVEDTEGEEEEESLLGSDSYDEVDNALPGTYSTFKPQNGETTPLTPTRKKTMDSTNGPAVSYEHPNVPDNGSAPHWQERAEIWGELQDQDSPSISASPTTTRSRLRSQTVPSGEATALLHSTRRTATGATDAAVPGPSSAVTPTGEAPPPRGRGFKKRRKSTGFPGFTARRTQRRSQPSLQDAFGGLWRLKWWKGERGRRDSDAEAAVGSPRPWSGGSSSARGSGSGVIPWPTYRDDPDADVPDSPLARTSRPGPQGGGIEEEESYRDHPGGDHGHGGGESSESSTTAPPRKDKDKT